MKITPYISDILDQPMALEHALVEIFRRPALTRFADGLWTGRYRRVILTGMGSSFFAAIPLHYRLLRAGVNVQLLETSELIHCLPQLMDPASLFVVISQSGQSAEVVHLLERARNRADILAVTNEAESPLALGARAAILIHAGSENTVSCKTYLNTLAALTALGDDLISDETLLLQLAAAPQAVQMYLQNWEAHVAFLVKEMQGIEHLFLLGRGDSLAAAGAGGLIIKEAAHFPAQSMSAAAFRHGPIDMTAPDVFALVFAGCPVAYEMNLRLVQDVRQFGGAAHLAATRLVQESAFDLPPVPAAALPLVEILPAQMLSLALAEKRRHAAGVFQFGAKVTVVL